MAARETSLVSKPSFVDRHYLHSYIPFAAQLVSSGLEHLFFAELYKTKPAILDRKQFGLPQACDVIGASGTWISLQCAGKRTIAPLAGMQLPANHQEAEYVTATLDEMWKLTTEKPSEAGLRCELQQFGPTGAVSQGGGTLPPKTLLSFAVCTLGGRSIPDILLSAGMPLASTGSPWLRLTNSSSQLLPGYLAEPGSNGATYVDQQTTRTTLLAIEGWISTILGFAFASFSIFYTQHERASKGGQHHKRATTAFSDLKRLISQSEDSSGAALVTIYEDAAKKIKALQACVQIYADHNNREVTRSDDILFEHIHRQLSRQQSPDPATLDAFKKKIEDLLQPSRFW